MGRKHKRPQEPPRLAPPVGVRFGVWLALTLLIVATILANAALEGLPRKAVMLLCINLIFVIMVRETRRTGEIRTNHGTFTRVDNPLGYRLSCAFFIALGVFFNVGIILSDEQ